MKNYIKTLIVYIARTVLRLGHIFPVRKNRILFSSYEGMQYTCSPKYIFQGAYDSFGKSFEYVWVLNDPEKLPEKYRGNIKTVRYLSIKHIYYLLTSSVFINNLGIEPILPKRKSQTFINTWHGGGAYKIVSSDLSMFSKSERFYIQQMRSIRKKGTDVFLSSSRKFTEISSRDFDIDSDKFIPSGLPRNDRFFNRDRTATESFRKKLVRKYNISDESLLVLYAPTFRGTHRQQTNIDNDVCSSEVVKALEGRFSRPIVFLFRSHISKEHKSLLETGTEIQVVDLTDYPDMQDLLDVADVLITDYSSSIWDYSIMGKPGFLYTPDLNEYIHNRGFYTPIETWPYPYAQTIGELCKNILAYSEKECLTKIASHQKALGSYENGSSTATVIEIIAKKNKKLDSSFYSDHFC